MNKFFDTVTQHKRGGDTGVCQWVCQEALGVCQAKGVSGSVKTNNEEVAIYDYFNC
jgi:hypothetical protein